MNRVTLVGRLTANPELRYTQTNKAFTRITIAVNRQKREDGTQQADFINCIAWEKQAELICTYLTKGALVGLEGRIQTGTYEKQDGTKGYTTDVLVQNIEFLESKKSGQQTTNNGQQSAPVELYNNKDVFTEFGEQVDIDQFLD